MSEKIEERIKELEERLAKTIPNKHTQKSINYIRAQLAKCRNDLVKIASSKKGGGVGFGIKKAGHAQVAFIGFPSVGKSSLLNLLTEGRTQSRVAAYDFTTITAVPGMMNIEQAQVQLIDLPGIILGASLGKGRGKEVLGAARNAELILILISFQPDGTIRFTDLETIRKELYDSGIRLNTRPARINLLIRESGGIVFTSQGHQLMDRDEVKSLMIELGYRNAGVTFFDHDVTADQLIDHVIGNRVYTKEFVVINKSDLMKTPIPEEEITKAIGHDHWQMISARDNLHIVDLKKRIFNELGLIRIYLKPPGKEADMENPLILRRGDTIKTLCLKLHKSFLDNFRFALIWGPSALHDGQKFTTVDHVLEDKDIVSISLKKAASR